jgi:pentatricopeptide repeat protein
MIDKGLSPSSAVVTSLIHGYSTCGKRGKAEELFDELVERGICPYAGVFHVNVVIDNLCKDGRIMEAQNLFDRMVSAGAKHDVVSYNVLIHGYCLAGDMDKAMKLVDSMILISLKPDGITYNTLINGYCKTGRVQDALTLFSQMLRTGVAIDTITYQVTWKILFESLVKCYF